MSGAILLLVVLAGPALLAIWLAKRHLSQTRLWGAEPSPNCVTGGEGDILPVEPIAGLAINRAPVDDTSHEGRFLASNPSHTHAAVDPGAA